MTDDKLISSEHLHTAASMAALTTGDAQAGFEDDAIIDFINTSTFHPPMEPLALAYGIILGRMSVRVEESERNGDSG